MSRNAFAQLEREYADDDEQARSEARDEARAFRLAAQRAQMDALPPTQRPAWRTEYRALVIAERARDDLKPLDVQDMDHIVDSWSMNLKLSRE